MRPAGTRRSTGTPGRRSSSNASAVVAVLLLAGEQTLVAAGRVAGAGHALRHRRAPEVAMDVIPHAASEWRGSPDSGSPHLRGGMRSVAHAMINTCPGRAQQQPVLIHETPTASDLWWPSVCLQRRQTTGLALRAVLLVCGRMAA